MAVHDWSRVKAGLFHHFHLNWISALCTHLNSGGLPSGYYALAEQVTSGPIPDIITLKLKPKPTQPPESTGGIALAVTPPRTRYVVRSEADPYLTKVNRVAIRDPRGRLVSNGSPWHRIQPESKRSPTLSQSPLAMPCRVCRCFWNPRSISQPLSMRHTRRHGLIAHRHSKTRFSPMERMPRVNCENRHPVV
jgi:hypothetical protein